MNLGFLLAKLVNFANAQMIIDPPSSLMSVSSQFKHPGNMLQGVDLYLMKSNQKPITSRL